MALKVTFYLFAYNQEHYIREACEAALAQDYPDLEIVFSDDCSTDKTFAIMQEVARAYQGPHRLVLNRNRENQGLIGHVNLSHQIASGDLIVVAAGDDLSLPHRVSTIVQAYEQSGRRANSIHSSVLKMDDSGQTLGLWRPPLAEQTMQLPEMALALSLLIGATHAWTRELATRFGPIAQTRAYEDLVIAFRSALVGEIAYIDEPLVKYRVGQVSVSHWQAPTTIDAAQKHLLKELRLALAIYRQRLTDCRRAERADLVPVLKRAVMRTQYRLLLVKKRRPFWGLMASAMFNGSLIALLRGHLRNRRLLKKTARISRNIVTPQETPEKL